jgi:cytoskeletal protein CcmA (bactofilin family)
VNFQSQSKTDHDVKFNKPVATEPRLGIAPASGKPTPDIVTTFGHGMLITGNIVCAGAVQIFGRVTGEIHASHLVISEGAKVEGKVIVQEAIIQGTFKGIMHGSSVKLQGTAVVEGEIHNRSLTIEQNALFEGVSRRLERPVEAPSMDDINGGAQKQPIYAEAKPATTAPGRMSESDIDLEVVA